MSPNTKYQIKITAIVGVSCICVFLILALYGVTSIVACVPLAFLGGFSGRYWIGNSFWPAQNRILNAFIDPALVGLLAGCACAWLLLHLIR